MRVQRSRTDVLPLTWEVPTTIAVAWLFLAVLALPFGQGIAFWVNGQGLVWPRGTLVESVLGLSTGEAGAGLTDSQLQALPSDVLVYGVVAISELLLGVVAVWVFTYWWGSIGPGAQFGIAGKRDVQVVLGMGNLRRRRTIIRPDLHKASRVRLMMRLSRDGLRTE